MSHLPQLEHLMLYMWPNVCTRLILKIRFIWFHQVRHVITFIFFFLHFTSTLVSSILQNYHHAFVGTLWSHVSSSQTPKTLDRRTRLVSIWIRSRSWRIYLWRSLLVKLLHFCTYRTTNIGPCFRTTPILKSLSWLNSATLISLPWREWLGIPHCLRCPRRLRILLELPLELKSHLK